MSTSTEAGINAPLERIEAPINYLVDTGEKPVSYTYEPPPGVSSRSGTIVKQTVSVINGRPMAVDSGYLSS